MNIQKNRILQIVVVVLAIAGFIVGMMVLPDTLVVQMRLGGSPGITLPKPAGLALISLLTAGGAIYTRLTKYPEGSTSRGMLISVVGLAVYVLIFVFNL